MYVPDKGDIVWLDFDLSAGKEIMKRRPVFVISRNAFNKHTGFAVMAPITSTVRGMKLEVELAAMKTQGSVLIHQLKSLDFDDRNIELIEKAPLEISQQVTRLATAIIA